MATGAVRRGWLLTVVLAVLVVLATVVLVRMLYGVGLAGPSGVVDGTTPAVAGARVESEALKEAALTAAEEQFADDTTEVVGAGIISVTSSDATVLLFVDTTPAGTGKASLKRVVVTMARAGGTWKLTDDRAV
ncbi:MAG: hypothetical protein H0X12_14915 [Nocardioides sp.]|nr:hypothetical protein [Nocardioides sp.]